MRVNGKNPEHFSYDQNNSVHGEELTSDIDLVLFYCRFRDSTLPVVLCPRASEYRFCLT